MSTIESPKWAVQTGGTGPVLGFGIEYDGVGGALVSGYFSGQASFGSTSLTSRGAEDAFVMHVTASGAIDWAVQAGGESVTESNGIAHDGVGGALVTGYFSGQASFGSTSLTSRGSTDAYVMHVTASGAIDWAVQAGGASQDQGYGIAHDGVGGALVTGYFSGQASFGSTSLTSRGSTDAYVMHVTASGAIDWAVQAGGASQDQGYGIAHDGAGGALVTGYFSGQASFGSTSLTSRGTEDAFVMHVTASGAIDWAVQAGGASQDQGYGIAHDGAGGALVTGYFSGNASFGSTSLTSRGTENAFVMHVTASGAIDWAVQAGGVSQDQGYGIAHDGVGGALVTGYFKGKISFGSTSLTSRGSTDAFVMHVTASGAIDWAVQAGGESVTESNGIAHDGVGGALVTGYFKGKISFGSTSLTSRGSTDTFVMHVTASGAIDWAVQTGSSSGGSSAQPRALAHDGVGGYLIDHSCFRARRQRQRHCTHHHQAPL
ncbi:pkd domain-containing protein [Chrysochromulina tobinii]|uniref:Pkd domain-containing protein n=1 Tax=Chrysochromulina tobinii TaxID=1460289 RepID=A0A0M0JH48_9EUKA|nr:pkd domain-containing protein [Chrysochromulina tobinii]|eukprot:KOO25904.1 pkd domain-containing protein [Chrysochromulina sp. CCMP291]